MKISNKIRSKYLWLLTFALFGSCNYLDIVPDDKPTLEDAFKNENEAQKALYGLYAYQPPIYQFQSSPTFLGTDESITASLGTTHWYSYKAFLYEEVSVSNPWFNYWSKYAVRRTHDLYASIRNCYQFINQLQAVPNINPENLQIWTGEAEFLIAYYHFILMQFYGPVIIVDKEYTADTPQDELSKGRNTYDECVSFVVDKLDLAAQKLPSTVIQSDLGRVTSVAAKAIKARVLLFAASPLYNGNSEFYSDFKNPDGTQLINQTYDKSKWERAKIAAKEAIDLAATVGIKLYYSQQQTSSDPFKQAELNYRYAFVDKFNSEVIWPYTRNEDFYQVLQRYSVPKIAGASGSNRPLGNIVPTLSLVEKYYTKNGLPLDIDPDTKDKKLWTYNASANTAEINLNREPRFYASIGYDGGNYEFNGSSFPIKALNGEPQGYQASVEYITETGYFFKKWVHPQSSYNASTNTFNAVRYPFPEVRLAELYLNYVEADFEAHGTLSTQGLEYINAIRKRSGIPALEDSWALVGGVPTGNALRDVIHRERAIEFAEENKRFFDLRRWKTAHVELNKPQNAWNIQGRTKEDFYRLIPLRESGKRNFTSPRNYLHPIPLEEININVNLVQNPKW